MIAASLPLATADPIDPENPPSLEELLATQPAGLVQVGNPWLNPGFEATSGVAAGTYPVPEAPSYASVAPPTIMYVDDAGGKVNTTYEVAIGGGLSGNALAIHYDGAEADRNLLVAQFFGTDGAPYVWENATALSMDIQSDKKLEEMHVSIYYGETSTRAAGFHYFPAGGFGWTRITVPIDIPAVPTGEVIRSAIFRIRTLEDANVTIDNIRVEGSTMKVQTQSDFTDGYTIVLNPLGVDESTPVPTVPSFATGLGERYLVSTHVVDYTDITPKNVPLSQVSGTAIAVLGSEFFDDVSPVPYIVPAATARSATDASVLLFAIDNETALESSEDGIGALWAWMKSGPHYTNPIGDVSEPASGYYSFARNQIAGYTLADAADYAATLVELGASEGAVTDPQQLAFLTPAGGGFDVRVSSAETGWIETTTVTVPGVGSKTVTLPGTGAPVLVHFDETLPAGATATSTSTIFTTGGAASSTLPVPSFTMCADVPGCATAITEILSLEVVSFNASASTDPVGEGIADYTWSFGDGGAGATGEQVTFLYSAPGTYDVTLTVTTMDGRSASFTQAITVTNRDPAATLTLSSETLSRVGTLTARVVGSDDDGSVETVVLKLDGAVLDSAAGEGSDFVVSGTGLALGAHLLEAYAVDDEGAESEIANATFAVVNLAPKAAIAASATVVPGGVNVTFTLLATDEDSPGAVASTLDFGDGSNATVDPVSPVNHSFATAGVYTVTLFVEDSEGANATATLAITVDATPPTTSASLSAPAASGWYTGPATVTLSVVDNAPGATIAYKLDGGSLTAYATSFDVTGDGAHAVTFQGTDAVGNVEPTVNSVAFQIDATQPDVDGSGLPADGSVVTEPTTITGAGTDATSGMGALRLLIDGTEVATGTNSLSYEWDTTQYAGPVELTLEAADVAGNVNATTVSVIVVPAPALGLPEDLPVETVECDGYPVTDVTPAGSGPWPAAAGDCAPGTNLVYAWACVGYGGNVDHFGTSMGFPYPGASTPHVAQDAAIAQAITSAIAEGSFTPEDVYAAYTVQNESSGAACSQTAP